MGTQRAHWGVWARGTAIGGALLAGVLSVLAACGDDDAAAPIIGSEVAAEKSADAMLVTKVDISLPFDTVVYNGTARKIVIRGEDNLIDTIEVIETEPNEWSIQAPLGLAFEQHQDIEIDIPFIDMVSVGYEGPVEFGDDPIEVWALRDAGMP